MLDRIQRVHLADDGSEHASWMLRYALRIACHLEPRTVQVLHVREAGDGRPEQRQDRHRLLADRCGVTLSHHELPPAPDVAAALADHVEPGPHDVVLVGLRAHTHGRGLALGTVGHALLARHDHAVLAMRIVEPGNMGLPRVLAAGISESPGLVGRLSPALQLFVPDLSELWLLHVAEVRQRFLGVLSYPKLHALEQAGDMALGAATQALERELGALPPRVEWHTSVSDRWPRQLVMDAHRARAHLLLLGASDHFLPRRFTLSNPLESVLHNAACDVAVFRAARVGAS